MTDINEVFERMIAEMRQLGEIPAPGNVLRQNSLLRYREAREKILDRFLAAFAEGYRLGKEDAENEPLTLEQLRASPHGKIKDSTLQSICNRANEIAWCPPEGEEDT